MEDSSNKKSEVAKEKPRDKNGHFIHQESPDPAAPPHPSNPVTAFFKNSTDVKQAKDDNTLIDVHVGNPLRKIADLLEDIKKQKAFTFDIKGSLGMAGILLVLTSFGLFGGTKAFCSKGEQSHMGVITILALPSQSAPTSWWDKAAALWDSMSGKSSPQDEFEQRVVLIEQNQTIYRLLGIKKSQEFIAGMQYIATGEVDACAQTITVPSKEGLQAY